MPDPLFGITGDAVRIGLDALAARQQVAAQNIAQANVPGARPMRLSFAGQLNAAAQAADRDEGWVRRLDESVANAKPMVAPGPADGGGLDGQVVELNQVAVHYQALAKLAGRHYSVLSLAVNEGRRS